MALGMAVAAVPTLLIALVGSRCPWLALARSCSLPCVFLLVLACSCLFWLALADSCLLLPSLAYSCPLLAALDCSCLLLLALAVGLHAEQATTCYQHAYTTLLLSTRFAFHAKTSFQKPQFLQYTRGFQHKHVLACEREAR